MLRMIKRGRVLVPVLLTCVLGTVAAERTTQARDRCRHVQGTIHSVFTSVNCTSPIGLCTVGKISGGGPLDGATTFQALSAAPSAGMPGIEPAANLSYSGELTISARRGTLVIRDLGVLDVANVAFTELDRPVSGTGRMENPTGVIFISGPIVDNGTAFDGTLSGQLCVDDD